MTVHLRARREDTSRREEIELAESRPSEPPEPSEPSGSWSSRAPRRRTAGTLSTAATRARIWAAWRRRINSSPAIRPVTHASGLVSGRDEAEGHNDAGETGAVADGTGSADSKSLVGSDSRADWLSQKVQEIGPARPTRQGPLTRPSRQPLRDRQARRCPQTWQGRQGRQGRRARQGRQTRRHWQTRPYRLSQLHLQTPSHWKPQLHRQVQMRRRTQLAPLKPPARRPPPAAIRTPHTQPWNTPLEAAFCQRSHVNTPRT